MTGRSPLFGVSECWRLLDGTSHGCQDWYALHLFIGDASEIHTAAIRNAHPVLRLGAKKTDSDIEGPTGYMRVLIQRGPSIWMFLVPIRDWKRIRYLDHTVSSLFFFGFLWRLDYLAHPNRGAEAWELSWLFPTMVHAAYQTLTRAGYGANHQGWLRRLTKYSPIYLDIYM